MLFVFALSSVSVANTPRWRNASTITTGAFAWVNPTNAKVSDNVRTTETILVADNLQCTVFSHNLRADASVDSIVVRVEGYGDANQTSRRTLVVQLTKNGTTGIGDAVTFTFGKNVGAEAYFEVDGLTDPLWGLTWTVSELNASTMGVLIKHNVSRTELIAIDHVQMKIFISGAGNCAGCSEFATNRDSADVWVNDGDPRAGSTTQGRGTLSTINFGTNAAETDERHPIYLDTLVFTGDVTGDGDGIPAGNTIKACTLWITVSAMPGSATDKIVYDLYEVTQPWDEKGSTNNVSWANRLDGVAWTTAGVTGTKKVDSVLSMEFHNSDTLVYQLRGGSVLELWDTIITTVADSVPIPIPLATAECIYAGTCYGIVLKYRTGPAESSFYAFGSAENITVARRPMFRWAYESAAGDGLGGRRRRTENNYIETPEQQAFTRFFETQPTIIEAVK